MGNPGSKPSETNAQQRVVCGLGIILLLVALTCNEWLLAYVFSPDGVIESSNRVLIWTFDLILGTAGLLLVCSRHRVANLLSAPGRANSFRNACVLLVFGAVCLCIGYAAGRYAVVSYLRRVVSLSLSSRQSPPVASPDSHGNTIDSRSYQEFNRLLDHELAADFQASSYWEPLLEARTVSARQHLSAEVRSKYLKTLEPWPGPKIDLDPEQEHWFSGPEVDASFVRLQTHPGLTLLSVLLVRHDIERSAPALLLLHGMDGGLKSIVSDVDYHHGFGMELARQGFIVLAPLNVASTVDTLNTLYVKSTALGWNLDAISLWQLVRAVDYLHTVDCVDQGHVGVYGVSLGGQQALRLGALEPRLSLVLCSGYFTRRFDWLYKRSSPCATSEPGDTMMNVIRPVDTALYQKSMSFLYHDLNFVGMIQPRFFGVVSGVDDPRYKHAREEFEKVSGLYESIGYPTRARFISFNGGHEVCVLQTLDFLQKWRSSECDDASD